MDHEEFIKAYETALASQDWKIVAPLMANNTCVTFSDGTVHRGKDNVQKAFEINFSKIKSEQYTMSNVTWLKKEATFGVYLFEFNQTGIVNDNLVSGSRIGTSVILKEGNNWKLLTEHLGKK